VVIHSGKGKERKRAQSELERILPDLPRSASDERYNFTSCDVEGIVKGSRRL